MKVRTERVLNVAAFVCVVLVTEFVDLWLALIVGALLLVAFTIWERVALRRMARG